MRVCHELDLQWTKTATKAGFRLLNGPSLCLNELLGGDLCSCEVLRTFHLLMKTVRLSASSSVDQSPFHLLSAPGSNLLSKSPLLFFLTFGLSRRPPEACAHIQELVAESSPLKRTFSRPTSSFTHRTLPPL